MKNRKIDKLKNRDIVASFDGETITSDTGLLLLREIDHKFLITKKFSQCFQDFRAPEYCKHTVHQLIAQRIFALCAGNEDLNDHDHLRQDPLYSILVEKDDVIASPVAGKSTLNRLEKSASGINGRYHKILPNEEKIKALLVEMFLSAYERAPKTITIDVDATDPHN